MMVKLLDAPINRKLRVHKIDAGKEARIRLHSLGINIDDMLKRISNTWFGPVLVTNESNEQSKIALGRGLADKIIVEVQ